MFDLFDSAGDHVTTVMAGDLASFVASHSEVTDVIPVH